jgi:hypothetical protein
VWASVQGRWLGALEPLPPRVIAALWGSTDRDSIDSAPSRLEDGEREVMRCLYVLLVLVFVASCREPTRRYALGEVVGEYVFAMGDEGLVLGDDGKFEHCWKEGASPSSEHGEWELYAYGPNQSSVTLFHHETGKLEESHPRPAGRWMEGLLMSDVGGRVGLLLNYYTKGRYYVKQEDGPRVCPRP